MNYNHVTFCFSLPRSRSQWLAWLYGKAVTSWHDPLKLCKHPLELKEMIDRERPQRLFIADTAAVLFHNAITASLPGARFLYVTRDPQDVCQSLKRQTGFPRASMVYEMYERMSEHRSLALPGRCGHFKTLRDDANRWWREVTGRPAEGLPEDFWRAADATVIDTPVNDQEADPYLRNLLMQNREKSC